MKVPLLDLSRQYNSIKEKIDSAIKNVLDSQHFILGKEVEELEGKIAHYCNVDYAIGVASGTDALLLSLKGLGIGKGDFVITTPFTFFATAGAIHNVGATPVFVDIEPDTYNIGPEGVRDLLRGKSFHSSRMNINASRIKAIIPVHLYGQIADMEPIMDIAEDHKLRVIEDAAQAIGSEYKERKAGSIGDLGCFSFFPTKNLGGYGDGGMITTKNKEIEERLRLFRVHGGERGYYHSLIGFNSRLDTIQAAVLLTKLPYLDEWNRKRQENAKVYSECLKDIGEVETPRVCERRKHIYHQYTIRIKNGRRDELQKFLKKREIATKVYYPLSLHLQECFYDLEYRKGDLPISEKATGEVLSLPVFPELTEDEIAYTCDSIKDFF
jgi:dTDP-4-amino-4,6-dideoxygalactose transaminase